jgi:hypothetical protein
MNISRNISRLAIGLSSCLLVALALPLSTFAIAPTPTTVYDATPASLPPNVASTGFEATSTSEFGDYIHLGGTNRSLNTVTVTMSDWALHADYPTLPSAGWTHPITLNVYSNHLGANGAPDTLLASKTAAVPIPWRPAADPTCSGGTAWRASDGNCYNGMAFNAVFDLSSPKVVLPSDIIVGVAYNTADYGAVPIHQPGPYNSLNVGVPTSQTVTVGRDDSADNVFWNTSFAGFYTDKGAAGVGVFRQDTNWSPNGTVAFKLTASAPLVSPPTSKDQCKNDGWKNFNNPTYKNQGQCIDYVNHHNVAIRGDVKYTAGGLSREAKFDMNTADNSGNFSYTDANNDWYKVKVNDVNASANFGYFAGVVTKAKNPTYVGKSLFVKVEDNHPDKIWGSFTADAATAKNGVDNKLNPADGPFVVTHGDLRVR